MKTLPTLIRHGITYLVGMLVAWLALYLSVDDLTTATAAANALVEPLSLVAGFVGVVLARLALTLFGKFFRTGSGEDRTGTAGGLAPCLLGLGMAVGCLGSLPSCSPAQLDAVRGIPIRLTFITPDGDIGYSSKSGLSVDYRSGK